jgi:hypothetical protein
MERVAKPFARYKTLVIFALVVIVLFDLRFLFDSAIQFSLPNKLQDLLTLTFSIIIESLPFVILGTIIAVAIRLWVPTKVDNWLPKRGIFRRLYISLLGTFLPVCECGNLPVARGLVARGFSPAESITFLLAAPILNPITLITTHQAFQGDTRILLARAVGALLIANLVGWLFSSYRKPEQVLTKEFIATCKPEKQHEHNKTDQSISLFSRELGSILPALFIGALIAGLIQTLVPRSILMDLGGNVVISVGVMMLLAFIVSICSNVDAFFALAFSSTFTVGSIVSFLIFGPMIDIKMLNLMRTTYRPAALLQITIVVALMSAMIGMVVNYAF